MSTLELASKNPEAFQALPEPYQADDCLHFYEEDNLLFCEPAQDQRHILGQWTAVYLDGRWKQFA